MVAIAVYGGWLAVTLAAGILPLWLTMPVLAVLIAWHGSLQHEAIHGHPTRSRLVNDVIAGVPLSLWIPYARYRSLHLRHHRDRHLTCPIEDPESYYLTGRRWTSLSKPMRAVRLFNRTLLGRLTVGPAIAWVGFWADEARLLADGSRSERAAWGVHLAGVAVVVGWLVAVAGLPFWAYLVACYFGTSLALVRSFAEHKAGPLGLRCAVVQSNWFFGLLFLNNNLHLAHHHRPSLAWYRLPAHARAIGAAQTASKGAGFWRGYGAVAKRHLLRPFHVPVHPDHPASDEVA
jgi:fatty acid desaturase